MNTVDLLIVVIVLSLGALGYAQGFIVGAASLAGLALGGLVGTRITRDLLERGTSDPSLSAWAPMAGLVTGLLITILGAMAMQDLGAVLRARVGVGRHAFVDHALGAVLLLAVGLLLAWFAAAATIGVPQLRGLRPQVVQSTVLQRLNGVLPDAGPVLGVIASYDPFPAFEAGGRIDIAAPDPELPADPEVAIAARSVVRVVGSACGYRVTGSGWVAAPGYVITNAHVVAGQEQTAVQVEGRGDEVGADVVSFDRVNDLAVLRVAQLELPPLEAVTKPVPGEAAVVLGYPEDRGFTTTAARFSDERTVTGDDIYGRRAGERRITSFRGVVRHGNSGGPVVDGAGRVLSTVFASTVRERVAGGYGVPNDLAASAVTDARMVPAGFGVDTGPCVG